MDIVEIACFLILTLTYDRHGVFSLTVCSSGWTPFKGNCYKIDDNTRKWDNADDYCTGAMATLAVIENLEEHNFIAEMVRPLL